MKINVISQTGQSALVEWVENGEPFRVFIPIEEILNDEVEMDTLDAGIPYGVDWESIKMEVTSKDLALNLRRAGIWTMKDLQLNPKVALAAIQATYTIDLAKLLLYASEQK